MGNQAGIIIRNVKNELFHSAKRLILNEVKGIECLHNGRLRTDGGADDFAKLHSIAETAMKNGNSKFNAILALVKQ